MEHREFGGRQRADPGEESVSLHVKVGVTRYDELYARARRERCTVPEVIRRVLDRAGIAGSRSE
jgi:hypothetical protein